MDVQQLVVRQQRLADQHPERADAQDVGPRRLDAVEHVGRVQVLGLDDVELELRAVCATGGGASLRPRPCGASGRVTTSTGRCSLAASRSRTVAANSDVPR